MERHHGNRESHKDKEHLRAIKLQLLLSFTEPLSKVADALHLNAEYCFPKKQVHN